MKTVIYLFNKSEDEGIKTRLCVCCAMADTGEVLAMHMCSHPSYMRGDLHDNRPKRQKEWSEKFANGYEIIELDNISKLPKEVLERNRKL